MSTPVTIIGNVVADPEPRISQAGKPWASVRVASTPRERDRQSGEWKDGESMFVSIPVYGDMAENVVQSLTKGTRIIACGKLRQRTYTDNQGVERTSLEMYDVEGIGPELKWATATVTRTQRGQGGSNNAQSDQWAQPPVNGPQNGFNDGGFSDQNPF